MSMIDHDDQDRLRAQSAADLDADADRRRYRRRADGTVYRVHLQARSITGPCTLHSCPYVPGLTLYTTNDRLPLDFDRCDTGSSNAPTPTAFPTPSELRARVEAADAAAVDALAASVARALESQWSPGGRVVVDVTQSQRVVDAVAARLRAHGWVVSYSSDQRDGRALAITAPPEGP